jgi:hypothetical protein
MSVSIVANALKEVSDYFEKLPALATEAAYFAINDTARDEEVAIRREMESQVNFPSGYLRKDSRFGIRSKATLRSLQAVISGRDRPTSLARFAEGATFENSRRRPLTVRVKPGKSTTFTRSDGKPSAFLVKLRNGNTGLAIRLPSGERPSDAYKPVPLTQKNGEETGVWLLYGPSVDQVLNGVIGDRSPKIADAVARNFFRQFDRLSRRG